MNSLLMKYFVLKPKGVTPYHEASRQAMLSYARVIVNENPDLANELREWVKSENIERSNTVQRSARTTRKG